MRALLAATALSGLLSTTPAMADGPVVIELYTSQGCSSCPPADALLHELAKRDDVIALALHVDYWDYIGWKDSFAKPEYTERQHAYARAARATTVYTPQMVINGQDHVIGSRPMEVLDQVARHRDAESPVDVSVTRSGDSIDISADADMQGDYLVQLVRYTPQESVAIRRGENAGHNLSYAQIVNDWAVVGRWDGSETLNLRAAAEGGDPVVVIIQQANSGPILAAAELR